MKQVIISALLSFLLIGCISTNNQPFKNIASNQTNFSKISSDMVSSICSNITTQDLEHDFYVVDFVNIDNLENNSQLGFILSNHLKSDLVQRCKFTIKEIELGQNIKIGRSGSKILTRELDELRSKVLDEESNLVIGTYAITTDKLMIFVKVIDLSTGIIRSSVTTSTKITQEILSLEGYKQQQETSAGKHLIYRPLVL